jgi:hypothetical protein
VDIRCCRGPEGLGDIVIHDEPQRWSVRTEHSRRYFRVYQPHSWKRVRWTEFSSSVVFAAALYSLRHDPRGLIPRGKPLSYRVAEVEFS